MEGSDVRKLHRDTRHRKAVGAARNPCPGGAGIALGLLHETHSGRFRCGFQGEAVRLTAKFVRLIIANGGSHYWRQADLADNNTKPVLTQDGVWESGSSRIIRVLFFPGPLLVLV